MFTQSRPHIATCLVFLAEQLASKSSGDMCFLDTSETTDEYTKFMIESCYNRIKLIRDTLNKLPQYTNVVTGEPTIKLAGLHTYSANNTQNTIIVIKWGKYI